MKVWELAFSRIAKHYQLWNAPRSKPAGV